MIPNFSGWWFSSASEKLKALWNPNTKTFFLIYLLCPVDQWLNMVSFSGPEFLPSCHFVGDHSHTIIWTSRCAMSRTGTTPKRLSDIRVVSEFVVDGIELPMSELSWYHVLSRIIVCSAFYFISFMMRRSSSIHWCVLAPSFTTSVIDVVLPGLVFY